MGSVPAERGGMAAGAVNTARQLGYALGVAALGSVFTARAAHVLRGHGVPSAAGASKAVSGGQAPVLLGHAPGPYRAALDGAIHAASVSGAAWTFWVSGIVALVAAPVVLALVRPARAERRERKAATSETPDATLAG
jgi:hypothetical protein